MIVMFKHTFLGKILRKIIRIELQCLAAKLTKAGFSVGDGLKVNFF